MKVNKRKDKKKSNTIDDIGITTDTLASRGGLTLFVHYLSGINLYPELEKRFGEENGPKNPWFFWSKITIAQFRFVLPTGY